MLIVQQLQSVLVESLMGAELQPWVTAIGKHGLMDSKISPLLGVFKGSCESKLIQVVDLGYLSSQVAPGLLPFEMSALPWWVSHDGIRA